MIHVERLTTSTSVTLSHVMLIKVVIVLVFLPAWNATTVLDVPIVKAIAVAKLALAHTLSVVTVCKNMIFLMGMVVRYTVVNKPFSM